MNRSRNLARAAWLVSVLATSCGVTEPQNIGFVALSAGGNQSCALTTGGAAYCWGWNGSGQLGIGTTTNSSVPLLVSGGLNFTALSAGGIHSCGLTTGGATYCWGSNSSGQLGTGTTTSSTVPVLVSGG
jgi:alpha-tubulin suppressor-like RCC1 family protein